jgi:hypothetical protein
MFGCKNNYVATIGLPTYMMEDLVLLVVAGNASTIYPSAGNSRTDWSPQRNHGTLVITMTHSATNLGNLIFNANGNAISQGWRNPCVRLPLSTDFGMGDFTEEMWAYTTAANPHPDVISINGNAGRLNATCAQSGSLLAQQVTWLGDLRRTLGYYSLSATQVAKHFSLKNHASAIKIL